MVFPRPCGYCKERFTPETKSTKLCNKCWKIRNKLNKTKKKNKLQDI